MMGFPSTIPMDYPLVLRAARFSALAHHSRTRDGKPQLRRYTDEPYISHLLDVAARVSTRTLDPHVISAAILHDVLEDTTVTAHELWDEFNKTVADLVVQVTDFYTSEQFPDLNRETRKRKEAERLGRACGAAQLIKAYDLIDNTRTIVVHDPGFAKVYLPEKERVLAHLTKLDPHVAMEARGSFPDGYEFTVWAARVG